MSPLAPHYETIEIYNSRILVVDDMAINREIIVGYLTKEGFQNIETANDGIEALEKAKIFTPDLIILDLLMPRLSGIETLQQFRMDPKYAQVPILIQTIIDNPEERNKSWKAGATDILTKPINCTELISRIKLQLNNCNQIRQLENYHQMAADDVAQGLELQRLLLPNSETIQALELKHHIKVESIFIPSRFLSGDLWGTIELNEKKLGVWIADFSGKGMRAALNTFRLHTLIQEYKYCADDPTELIDILNNRLIPLLPIGQFSTFLIGVIDFEQNVFEYAAASSTHPLVYFSGQKKYLMGDATGMPLGILKDQGYPLRQLPLPQGASLLLYSDVLWEENGGIPGITTLEEIVEELNGQTFSAALKSRLHGLQDFSLPDDLTIVEVHRIK